MRSVNFASRIFASGLGLLIAVELAHGNAKGVYTRLLEMGLVTNAVTETALRLAPPLNVSEVHIREAVGLIRQALHEVNAP